MFEVNRTELADQARTMNFVRDTLEKVLRLTEILNYLVFHPTRSGDKTLRKNHTSQIYSLRTAADQPFIKIRSNR